MVSIRKGVKQGCHKCFNISCIYGQIEPCQPGTLFGVDPYSKCPISNHQSQQWIKNFGGNHISVDIKKNIDLNWQKNENEFFNWKKTYCKENIQKKKNKTTPQHFCVAENCMLLEGGVLYGFTGHDFIDAILERAQYFTCAG